MTDNIDDYKKDQNGPTTKKKEISPRTVGWFVTLVGAFMITTSLALWIFIEGYPLWTTFQSIIVGGVMVFTGSLWFRMKV